MFEVIIFVLSLSYFSFRVIVVSWNELRRVPTPPLFSRRDYGEVLAGERRQEREIKDIN